MNERSASGYMQFLPNLITCSRIVMAGLFPLAPERWHLAIVAAAVLSEFLDGFLARLLNATSYLGQVLDPIADKLFFLSVSVTWIWLGELTLGQWLLLGTRDLGVLLIVLGLLAIQKLRTVRSIEARYLSKITTALQYAVFFVILLDMEQPVAALVLLTGATGIAAALQYLLLVRQSLAAI